ncbi:hypothetical protein DFJ74DRAFT_11553 [Hyaloraphidium curvatum]|nr:hypothetical protein DFJ74DRAFT_11553 [Hyaloraphidium curvatum]
MSTPQMARQTREAGANLARPVVEHRMQDRHAGLEHGAEPGAARGRRDPLGIAPEHLPELQHGRREHDLADAGLHVPVGQRQQDADAVVHGGPAVHQDRVAKGAGEIGVVIGQVGGECGDAGAEGAAQVKAPLRGGDGAQELETPRRAAVQGDADHLGGVDAHYRGANEHKAEQAFEGIGLQQDVEHPAEDIFVEVRGGEEAGIVLLAASFVEIIVDSGHGEAGLGDADVFGLDGIHAVLDPLLSPRGRRVLQSRGQVLRVEGLRQRRQGPRRSSRRAVPNHVVRRLVGSRVECVHGGRAAAAAGDSAGPRVVRAGERRSGKVVAPLQRR